MPNEPITVGELRSWLEGLSDDDKLHLPGGLSFYRLKQRAEREYHIEVNEPQGYLSNSFKKRNPHVKVAFINTDNVEWDESGIISGPIDVVVS